MTVRAVRFKAELESVRNQSRRKAVTPNASHEAVTHQAAVPVN
jgi:hypothetical protein